MQLPEKWPNKNQWAQLFKILTKKERILFSVFLLGIVYSLSFLLINFYLENTKIQPAVAGEYSEGLIGQPRFLNPIYAQTRDVDRDLVELLFSGLLKYSPEGKLIPDLAEYNILDEGKIYEFYLKEGISWQDGNPLTVDDVIFTIETVQDPDFKSPLRVNWLGVEIEKISDNGIRFELSKPSAVFLENCTLKIIPKHIWESISPENFPLTFYNLKPVGSGPYKLEELSQNAEEKITSLKLLKNQDYFGNGPYIPQITFYFFNNEDDLIKSYRKGEIKGFALNYTENLPNNNLQLHSPDLPRYFALFFNLEESEVLADLYIRKALNYATDKNELLEKVLSGRGKVVNSPIMPQIFHLDNPSTIYPFDLEEAKKILDEAGFSENDSGERKKIINKKSSTQLKSDLKLGSQGDEVEQLQRCLAKFPDVYPEGEITGYFGALTEKAVIAFQEKYKEEILIPNDLNQGTGQVRSSTRTKINELCFSEEEVIPLEVTLTTVEQPLLVNTASLLKEQWSKIGVNLNIKTFDDPLELEREVIKTRDYEILLFGEVLGSIPDPFPFWHSSQKKDPGLNLSLYDNKKCDTLLEEARKSLDEKERGEKLEEFQELLLEDAPALFLYSPDYLYFVDPKIQGINDLIIMEPSKRFSNAENWFIKTKRVWK